MGKSELALEFARRSQDQYPNGTFFINAGAGATIELARIGRLMLDLEFPPDLPLDEQLPRTIRALGTAPSLLIFDNVRSVEMASGLVPPAGMPCHVIITTVLDRWDLGWQQIVVEPLSETASIQLIESLAGSDLAHRYGPRLADVAGGLPVQIVPASAALKREVRRGHEGTIAHTVAKEAARSFQGVYDHLDPAARLLLHAAAHLNTQRIPVDELRIHLLDGCGWSAGEFQNAVEACVDVHVLQGVAELRMHQLFGDFILRTDQSEIIASALNRARAVQARRLAELASEVSAAPNRVDRAASLLAYRLNVDDWKDVESDISVTQGEKIGTALFLIGRFPAAVRWFERAVTEKEKGDRVDHESLSRSLHHVGYCLTRMGNSTDALPWFERAVAETERGDASGNVDHDSLGRSLSHAGSCLSDSGELATALQWFERAVTEKEKGDLTAASIGRASA